MSHWTTGQVFWFFLIAAGVLFLAVWGGYELAWYLRGQRYRATVAATRLAIRQEDRERARQQRPRSRISGGSVVVDLSLDTTAFQEQLRKVQAEAERVDTRIRDMAARLADDVARRIV